MSEIDTTWKAVACSSPIADTGDYDGHWELTNGNIVLITNDDDLAEVDFADIVDVLNNAGIDFTLDDTANIDKYIAESRLKDALNREAVLVAALERLRDCDWVITLPDRMDAVREIAREALAKYRGKR